ncbi:3-hydroxyisobutyryl-CoA hydrolase [uncultured Ramlibacter sp.]|uniref:3-hydroxyisobutyryl-CoA hydrolase n=1 Tax=uncultured Ramlibacter sp. TaxID=260755 RepID=UPI002635A9AA|nr:3-hydroxyisobutyryl-CoA hydrolase [uncultured Ramlibacter sp.]
MDDLEEQTMNHALTATCDDVLTEVRGHLGCITLNRPRALNALSLPMIRALAGTLLAWRDDPQVQAVAIRGMGKEGPFGAFCAGGDIRFFHQAMLRGDAELEDFFTEEYALNHLIHHYPKPYIAFMDGIVMGGGMGISQGAACRIVRDRTMMAMPVTNIGLFPVVGGGWFLARCPSQGGVWLALTSEVIGVGDALSLKLADVCFDASRLGLAWEDLSTLGRYDPASLQQWQQTYSVTPAPGTLPLAQIATAMPRQQIVDRLVKDANDDAAVLEAMMAQFRLTAREAEVLYWVVKGKTNRDIGDILGASPATVKKHLERVFAKLGVETRTAAAAMAINRIRQLHPHFEG